MKQHLGSLAILGAGSLWGIISLFVRELSAMGLDSLQIGFLRSLLAALMLLVWLLLRDRDALRVRLRDLWCFVGTGIVSLTFFSWCYFTTIQASEASVAVVLLYTSPIFVMLLSAVCFGERITPPKLAALAMTFCGSVLVAGLLGGGYTLTPGVFLIGLGAGLGYGLYSIFGRCALERGYGSLTVTFYTFVFSSLGGAFLSRPAALAGHLTPKTLLWGAAIALVCSVLPYLLYTYGLSQMESGKAAILATIEPLVGALVGMVLYHESHGPGKLLGMALIFAAVVLLNLPQGQMGKKPKTQVKMGASTNAGR